jgi:hypothetical protein
MGTELTRWVVRPVREGEATQSNTFGPLLALGIDGVSVEFPATWERNVFIETLAENPIGRPSKSLMEFKAWVKARLVRVLGDSTLPTFLRNCDDPGRLHLVPETQERVLFENENIKNFFAMLTAKTKVKLAGQTMIARKVAGVDPVPTQWECPGCTFINDCALPMCEICDTPRPPEFCRAVGGRRRRKTLRKHKKSRKSRKSRK